MHPECIVTSSNHI